LTIFIFTSLSAAARRKHGAPAATHACHAYILYLAAAKLNSNFRGGKNRKSPKMLDKSEYLVYYFRQGPSTETRVGGLFFLCPLFVLRMPPGDRRSSPNRRFPRRIPDDKRTAA
jgi:hypothetical protein